MYKHLYDSFKHWYRGGSIYFYSDPHFGDAELQQKRKNNISDDEQVKRINSKVGKKDTIIFLGDIGDVEFIKKIRGYKVLIMGNHDKGASNYKRGMIVVDSEVKEIDNKLFDEVYEGALMISDKILLSHEPVDFKYALNIHGHDHGGSHYKNLSGKNQLNMCAEHIDYTPVSLKTIVEYGLLKNIDNIHRDSIDNAIKRKNKTK